MESTKREKVSNFLKADFSEVDTIWLTNSYTLRKTIGVLGLTLPFLLYALLYIASGFAQPLDSISHYYYTRVSGIFVSIICFLAIFLIIYKGKALIDLFTSLVAGLAALLVVFFPTGNISEICCDTTKTYSVTILSKSEFREIFHYISAGIFLVCLSYMSIFLFTKSDKPKEIRGKKKKIRNRIYRLCGAIMLIALAVIFFGGFLKWIPEDFYIRNQLTFWMETLAIESFGLSWLIKGETLFKD